METFPSTICISGPLPAANKVDASNTDSEIPSRMDFIVTSSCYKETAEIILWFTGHQHILLPEIPRRGNSGNRGDKGTDSELLKRTKVRLNNSESVPLSPLFPEFPVTGPPCQKEQPERSGAKFLNPKAKTS